MKKLFALTLGAIALTLTSCNDDANTMIDDNVACLETPAAAQLEIRLTGKVTKRLLQADRDGAIADIDGYGMLVPSFTPSDLMAAGFEYSDLLNVRIGDDIVLNNVPFVTGFNEVGVLETCFCDYNGTGQMYGFGLLHGNFHERIGGNPGDKIEVTLAKRHGYKETWQIMKSVYTPNRDDYASDEVFANFREVTTQGMKQGVLYRSSNPLNPKDNAVRYAYVDQLARQVGIQTEIDLADTNEKVMGYRQRPDFSSTYCPALFDQGQVIALGLTADTYGQTFMTKLGDGLRFMIEHQPPYLIHCNEGKDRCGFVIMLLECLTGATYQEVAADYMQTLINFYKIEPGSQSYQLRQTLSVDRLVWLLENVEAVDDFTTINWEQNDPTQVNLQQAARDYVRKCGLTEQECAQLESLLKGE